MKISYPCPCTDPFPSEAKSIGSHRKDSLIRLGQRLQDGQGSFTQRDRSGMAVLGVRKEQ
jgi:hypothetical protein